ncbi:hypothetical protein ES703_58851 [subsurface metagenome]
MRRCCATIDSISEFTGKLLSWVVLVIVAIFCWEVLLRSVLNAPTIWAHECSQYFFAVYFALGGAYALKLGGMVNVDILVKRLKPRTRAIVDTAMGIITFIFLVGLAGKGIELALYSISINETSQTVWGPPIYPLKIIVVLGAALLCLQAVAKFIRDIAAIKSGKVLT